MKQINYLSERLDYFLHEPGHQAGKIIEALMEFAADSNHLVVGYASDGTLGRDELIPYFHLIGPEANLHPLRSVLIGG